MKLYSKDISFLAKSLKNSELLGKLLLAHQLLDSDKIAPSRAVELDFSADELSILLEELGVLVSSKGISDGEINAVGKYIDSLIDLVSNELEDEDPK